jgi:hypothetical protein
VMMADSAACLNISRRSTTGTRREAIRLCSTEPGPAGSRQRAEGVVGGRDGMAIDWLRR